MRFLSLMLLLLLWSHASAEEEKKYQLAKATYDGIMAVQVFLDGNETAQAETLLKKLETSKEIREKLDKAYVRFYLGYFYTLQDDAENAMHYFLEALGYEALPSEQIENAYLNLVQLALELELQDQALEYLDQVIARTNPPKSLYYIYKAQIYLGQQRFAETLDMIQKATAIDGTPQLNWLKMKYYCHYMQQEYALAIGTLKLLIAAEPDTKEYWLQFSSLYSIEEKFAQSLAVLDIARVSKMELTQNEWLRLIAWLRYANVPYKAARIMEQQMETGTLEANEKQLNLLGDLFYEAKDYDEAVVHLQKAAQLHHSAKIYYKLARIAMQRHHNEAVIENILKALQYGDEEKRGEKHLLLGKAYYELEMPSKARSAFQEALKYEPSRKMAQAWLQYIRS